MKNKAFRNYYFFAVILVLAASFYPLYMGIRVVSDMITNGTVMSENYPKYIIPYTPVSLAVIAGTLLMPPALKYAKRFALPAGTFIALAVFFLTEFLLESQVTVTTATQVPLESWQMSLCYVPPEPYLLRVWDAVDVLLGGYSPGFKLHFYLIAVVLILSLLNCVYGFGRMLLTGDTSRKKPLILQTVASVTFLGLCIWACFTSFYRSGSILLSPVSAILMGVFFVVFGLTAGLYAGSFLYGRRNWLAVLVPAAVSAGVTVAMYIGEMILLSGHLYRFGTGFFFQRLGQVALAPVDILIILLSGGLCGAILWAVRRR